MPSEATPALSGQCYCGAVRVETSAAPITVAYCHCTDCRRLSGAPVSAFAAFGPDDLVWMPTLGAGRSHAPGVQRWFCETCGSPLASTYDYLPNQVYVPVGRFDQVNALPPRSHSHAGCQVAWLHLRDDLPRSKASGRDLLNNGAP